MVKISDQNERSFQVIKDNHHLS